MKLLTLLLPLALAIPAQAAFQLKAGLWEVESKNSMNGKSVDPQAQLKEMMKSMPAAQRTQMEKMLASKGVGMGSGKGMRICHTDKTMSDESLVSSKEDDCKIKNKKELSDGMRFDIDCKRGSGTAEYHRIDDSNYSGWNEFQTKEGKMRMDFKGKYISKDCGSVKPITQAK